MDRIEPVLGLDIVARALNGALIRVAVVVPAKAHVLAATTRIHCVVSIMQAAPRSVSHMLMQMVCQMAIQRTAGPHH